MNETIYHIYNLRKLKNPNIYYDYEEYLKIKITNKKHGVFYALIDKDDFDKVKDCNWYLEIGKHTQYLVSKNLGKMHRLIMGYPKNLVIDHINNNGLDNRKVNLRAVGLYENSRNSINTSNTLGIRGITHHDGRYIVKWVEDGINKSKTFNPRKLGDSALEMAIEFRRHIEETIYKMPKKDYVSTIGGTPIINNK